MEHFPEMGWAGRAWVVRWVEERGENGGCGQDGMGEIKRDEGDTAREEGVGEYRLC